MWTMAGAFRSLPELVSGIKYLEAISKTDKSGCLLASNIRFCLFILPLPGGRYPLAIGSGCEQPLLPVLHTHSNRAY
jgi:hypothetical protein